MNDQPTVETHRSLANGQIVVLITAPSQEVARQIASTLLHQKLAACVNVLPAIRSYYIWKGTAQEDEEVLLLVKTRAALFESRLVPAVKAAHPMSCPRSLPCPSRWDWRVI